MGDMGVDEARDKVKLIPLSRGLFALVDDSDHAFLSQWKWYALWGTSTKSFYAVRKQRNADGSRSLVSMHTAIMNPPAGMVTDHVSRRDTLDNRRANLRWATHSQNMANSRPRMDNTTGYRGVVRHGNRWQAAIRIDGKKIYLGSFRTPEIAANAYNAKAREVFGEFYVAA